MTAPQRETEGREPQESPRDRAFRLAIYYALRKRDRVRRISEAINFAGLEGNMQGRLHPARQGMTPEQTGKLIDAYISEAIRRLRRKP